MRHVRYEPDKGRFDGGAPCVRPRISIVRKAEQAYFRPRDVQTALKMSSIFPVPFTELRIPFFP